MKILKKYRNVIISQCCPNVPPKQPGMHSALKRCNATDRSWNRYTVSQGLFVASVKRRQSSFKNFVTLEPMGSNDLKAGGTI